MPSIRYSQKALDHLQSRDKKLGAAIAKLGMLKRSHHPDLFSALIQSLVSQQISSKAAVTVGGRLRDLVGEISPENIHNSELEAIQKCGMSMRKATYIKGIAAAVMNGELSLQELHDLPDEDVVKKLSALNGIGVWTAEMMLIFSLGRPDVVSWGDLAIRRGMMNLYGHKTLTRAQFEKYRKRYSPYGSVASLYLWEMSV